MYVDDIIIFGRTFQEQLERLELILCRLKEAGLGTKGLKCRFFPIKQFSWTYCVDQQRRSWSGKDKRGETHERPLKYQTIAGAIRTHWVLTQVY